MRRHLTLKKGIENSRKHQGWVGRGLTCVASLLLLPALGEVRLAPLFGNNVVLQAESKVPIWGTANPVRAVSSGRNDVIYLAAVAEPYEAMPLGNGQWGVMSSPFPSSTVLSTPLS